LLRFTHVATHGRSFLVSRTIIRINSSEPDIFALSLARIALVVIAYDHRCRACTTRVTRVISRVCSRSSAHATRARDTCTLARASIYSAQRLNGSSRISRAKESRAASLANRTRYEIVSCEIARRATILRARVNRERNLTDIPVLRA